MNEVKNDPRNEPSGCFVEKEETREWPEMSFEVKPEVKEILQKTREHSPLCKDEILFDWFGFDQMSKTLLFIQHKQCSWIQTNNKIRWTVILSVLCLNSCPEVPEYPSGLGHKVPLMQFTLEPTCVQSPGWEKCFPLNKETAGIGAINKF